MHAGQRAERLNPLVGDRDPVRVIGGRGAGDVCKPGSDVQDGRRVRESITLLKEPAELKQRFPRAICVGHSVRGAVARGPRQLVRGGSGNTGVDQGLLKGFPRVPEIRPVPVDTADPQKVVGEPAAIRACSFSRRARLKYSRALRCRPSR